MVGGKQEGYWEEAQYLFIPREESPLGSEFSLRGGTVLREEKFSLINSLKYFLKRMRIPCDTLSSWKDVRWESVVGWWQGVPDYACLRKSNELLNIRSGTEEQEKNYQ